MQKIILSLLLLSATLTKAQFTSTNIINPVPYPVAFEIAPDGRFFVSCKGGAGFGAPANAQVRVYSSTGVFQANLWDFTDSVETYFERGVLGVACDPNFMVNHYVYVFYNHDTPAMIRVMRFKETAGVGSDPTVIFEVNDPYSAGNHSGGNIHFMPSDTTHLYISIGDRAVTATAQDLTKWAGKMLRINKDGSIPTDNPYYDDGNPATGNDDRIWSYGHRNMWDFCFNPGNDTLYGSENGLNTEDEINLITRGDNYGWPFCEGTVGSCTGYRAPLEVWGPPVPAVTGIMFYTSTVFSAYTNHLIVTDYNDGNVWDVVLGNAPAYDTWVSTTLISALAMTDVTDIQQGPEGCWYTNNTAYGTSGKIVRICPTGMGTFDYEIENAYKVYPNPANDVITVEGKDIKQIQLFDMGGKIVLSANTNTMDISNLPQGVYQLRVNNVSAEKVVKM
jgi:glucose/arabinose dehydrogenase